MPQQTSCFSTGKGKKAGSDGVAQNGDLGTALLNFALNNKKHLNLQTSQPKKDEDESLLSVLDQIKAMPAHSLFAAINESLLQLSEAHKQKGAAAKQGKKTAPVVAQSFKRMLK